MEKYNAFIKAKRTKELIKNQENKIKKMLKKVMKVDNIKICEEYIKLSDKFFNKLFKRLRKWDIVDEYFESMESGKSGKLFKDEFMLLLDQPEYSNLSKEYISAVKEKYIKKQEKDGW